MKIGIALSGGGTRAIIFHLGMFKALAESEYWQGIHYLSSVSGGSLCVALIMANNGYRWPTSKDYINSVLPKISLLLTSPKCRSLQIWMFLPFAFLTLVYCIVLLFVIKWFAISCSFILYMLAILGLFCILAMIPKACWLSCLLKRVWKIDCDIAKLPRTPQWAINCTCWETGKNWRFEQRRMGDYKANYVKDPSFPLSHAAAASAAFPWAIGAFRFNTTKYTEWRDHNKKQCKPIYKKLSLWDGGLYDNLGLESLFKLDSKVGPQRYIKQDCEFLIVSDASAKLSPEERKYFLSVPIPMLLRSRIAEITTDQVRSLRARQMFNYFKTNLNGIYICIGDGIEYVSKCDNYEIITSIKTSLMNFTGNDFDILFNHAYELTKQRIIQQKTEYPSKNQEDQEQVHDGQTVSIKSSVSVQSS